MSYKTTRQADQDIIDIYVHGVQAFGPAQASAAISLVIFRDMLSLLPL